MSAADTKFLGFCAFWFAFGSALTLTLAAGTGYSEWAPAMYAVTGTTVALFVIMFAWELGPPFWRGLTGKPTRGAVETRECFILIGPAENWLWATARMSASEAWEALPRYIDPKDCRLARLQISWRR